MVASGQLMRIRRDRYARLAIYPAIRTAIVERGLLSCCSLLVLLGIFVHTLGGTHVQLPPATSHFKRPRGAAVVRHWAPLREPERATLATVSVVDAILQAARCLPARDLIATLDSAVRQRYITLRRLHSLAELLPKHRQRLVRLVNGKADSGVETYVRLILQALGLQFEQQVVIPGVGRVDFLIEGWLILEVDSLEFHSSWEQRCDDLRRDIAAAKLGYTSLRLLAEDALYRRDRLRGDLQEAIAGLRASHFSGETSTRRPKQQAKTRVLQKTPEKRMRRPSASARETLQMGVLLSHARLGDPRIGRAS